MRTTIVLALLLSVATADSGWSWGAEDKSPEVQPARGDEGRAFNPQLGVESSPSVVEIPASDFNQPLPLEPHSPLPLEEAVVGDQGQAAAALLQEDKEREARFLGLSDTLCSWGVGIRCNNDNKIKKKGHGYPHTVSSSYGAPPPNFNIHDTGYASSSYASDFNNYNTKPKGHFHKEPHKGNKKGALGVTDLISGFINSYTKPKGDKGYAPPASLPTYLPPSQPLPTYGTPIHVAPKPSYVAPTYAAPTYQAPKVIKPKPPVYSPPKPAYIESSYSVPVHKPKYVVSKPKVTTVYTHTVAPIKATKVQHLHSHTHVYHGAKIVKPDDTGYSHHGSSGYDSHFQKKSDNSGDNILSGSDSNAFGTSTSFVSGSSGASFGSHGTGSSHGSIGNSNFNGPLSGSDSAHIPHNVNPFDEQSSSSFNSNGFSSHTKFHHETDNFQASAFRPSNTEFGFKPSATTIQDMINQNSLSNFARTVYDTDCHCIPESFCAHENIVRPYRDLSHVIDARNNQGEVYSNATDSAENSTDTETSYANTRTSRAFNFDAVAEEEEPAEDYDYDTTVAPPVEDSDPEEAVPETPAVVRRRRDTEQAEENFSDVEGRQLKGYTPGAAGCGSGTVCCKRPVYTPARALPVCGISNDENIHGRIKTKHDDFGRASFGEYPWQGAILKRSDTGDMVYVCGVSVVDGQFVLTAAHCVKDLEASTLKVRLGEWDVRDKTEFYPHVEFPVSGIYLHPDFYEGNLENDIAVMRLQGRIDFSKYPHIAPVCLPRPGSDFTGQVCRITGWGKDSWGSDGEFQAILKETEVPIMRKDLCQQILRTTKLGGTYSLHEGMMCAGGEEHRDACKGDGGGPLVCKGSAGEYQLAGIVSWGIGCGTRGIPGVYVDVPHYIDWIRSITG